MPLDPLAQHALAAGVGGLGGYALGHLGGGDDEERARKARTYALLGAGLGGGGSLAYSYSPQIQALMSQLMGSAPSPAPAAAPPYEYEAKMTPALQASLAKKHGPGVAPRQSKVDHKARQLMAMGVKPVPGSRYYQPKPQATPSGITLR